MRVTFEQRVTKKKKPKQNQKNVQQKLVVCILVQLAGITMVIH